MSEVKNINIYNFHKKNYYRMKENNNKDNSVKKKRKNISDKLEIKMSTEKGVYKNPEKVNNSLEKTIDPVKRPIRIDNSNNIFYINHNAKNKTVKIKPGVYNLTELSRALQAKVNESFGIGRVRVKLTASGSDRLIKAEDSSIYDYFKDL